MREKATDPLQQARKHESSQFRGVSPCGKTRFRAQIFYNGQQSYIGCFKSAAEAAVAYDKVARKVHGDRAKVNFPLGEMPENGTCADSDGGKTTPHASSESDSLVVPLHVANAKASRAVLAMSELKSCEEEPPRNKPKLRHATRSSYDAALAPYAASSQLRLPPAAQWSHAQPRVTLSAIWRQLDEERQAVAARWVQSSSFGWVHNSLTQNLEDDYVALSIRCDDIEQRIEEAASPNTPAIVEFLHGKRSNATMF